jgi:hypothetical protein
LARAWARRDRDKEGTKRESKREREREREKNFGLASPYSPEDARDGHAGGRMRNGEKATIDDDEQGKHAAAGLLFTD